MNIWFDEDVVLEQLEDQQSTEWILSNLDQGEVREYAVNEFDLVEDGDEDISQYTTDSLITELSSRFKTRSEVNDILAMLDINDVADFVENN